MAPGALCAGAPRRGGRRRPAAGLCCPLHEPAASELSVGHRAEGRLAGVGRRGGHDGESAGVPGRRRFGVRCWLGAGVRRERRSRCARRFAGVARRRRRGGRRPRSPVATSRRGGGAPAGLRGSGGPAGIRVGRLSLGRLSQHGCHQRLPAPLAARRCGRLLSRPAPVGRCRGRRRAARGVRRRAGGRAGGPPGPRLLRDRPAPRCPWRPGALRLPAGRSRAREGGDHGS